MATADDSIECAECGHAVERHGPAGCTVEGCACDDAWTVADIHALRRRHGLLSHFDRWRY